MTLRIEALFEDDVDPLPDEAGAGCAGSAADEDAAHVEDRMLRSFDAFLAQRGSRAAERALGASLLLAALDHNSDAESGWEHLALVGCIGRVAGGPLALVQRARLTAIACELVNWLRAEGRVSASARRRLLRQLAPEPRRVSRLRAKLAA